jgi:hypothetical protein
MLGAEAQMSKPQRKPDVLDDLLAQLGVRGPEAETERDRDAPRPDRSFGGPDTTPPFPVLREPPPSGVDRRSLVLPGERRPERRD